MLKHVIRRLAISLPVIVCVSLITFVLMHVLPGDPVLAALGGQALAPEVVAQLRAEMGLNDPLYIQYSRFLFGALRGDFGRSMRTRALVTQEIAKALPPTVQLTVGGLLVALLMGIPLGIAAALRQSTWVDWFGISLATLAVSMPIFWLGLILISVFSLRLAWMPAAGHSGIRSLILPSIALGFGGGAIIARMTRSSLVEILQQDYIRTARAKGLHETAVVVRHALKNAMIPVITTVGLQVGSLLSGAVMVESVFSRPGMGRLFLQAVTSRDFPLVQALVLLVGTFYVTMNVLVDILYAWLDPRIRYE